MIGRPILSALVLICVPLTLVHAQRREIDLRAADGTVLRGTYFSAGKPGPAVMLFHMCDGGQRAVWNRLGPMLAARGIHAIAMDNRGHGQSGGRREAAMPLAERRRVTLDVWPRDIDVAFDYLVAQSGVDRTRIGAAGGSCGAGNAVRLASRHPEVKTLVLLAGGLMFAEEFLPKAPWMPVLAVAAHDDGDAVTAMHRAVSFSTAPESRLKEYAKGGHGTDLFRVDRELEPMIADWFVQHLITRPVRR